jgi:hypothetical protein
MQEGLFLLKKSLKYCDGIPKYFTIFSQKKLQENKKILYKYLVQIIVKEY